jgi:hypothetical protein
VFVALGIQHVTLMRRIVICGLPPPSTIILHIIPQMTLFPKKKKKKKNLLDIKFYLIFSATFV